LGALQGALFHSSSGAPAIWDLTLKGRYRDSSRVERKKGPGYEGRENSERPVGR